MKLSVHCKQCSSGDFKIDYLENVYICKDCDTKHDKSQLVIIGRISEKTLQMVMETLAEGSDE